MKNNKKKVPLIYQIWEEGKYLDLWNIPHFLIGILIGFALIFFSVPLIYSLIIVFLIKLSWEIYEHINVIKETIPNKILDIVTGLLGYLFIFYINNLRPITLKDFFIVLAVELFIGSWGLYSAKKLDNFIKSVKK